MNGIRGTGLGLSITKYLVEAHGGRMGVESVFGQGSQFWFEVPLFGPSRRRLEALAMGIAACWSVALGCQGRVAAAPLEPKHLDGALLLHRFGIETQRSTPTKIFAAAPGGQQVDWLKAQGYQSVSLAQVAQAVSEGAGALPAKALLLSGDDGYKGRRLGGRRVRKSAVFTRSISSITGSPGKAQLHGLGRLP